MAQRRTQLSGTLQSAFYVQMPVLQLVEHRLDGCVIGGQRFTNPGRETRVLHQVIQAFAREIQVLRTGIV